MSISPEQFAALGLETAAAGLARGEFTAAELLEASLARMDAFEPVINAVITRDDEAARRRAAAADADGTAGKGLAGLPVAVKDNIMTRGLRTTCGSHILENFVPPYDAGAAEKLQAAGAVINAKTNMDEFAMGATGESSAYGPSRNPWSTGRVTGGSSSGSAAVTAYGGALAALGSDTGGSIRQPAAFCGLVGMKPTYGRVSRHGLGALASSLDQIGPFAKTVRDCAFLLDVISGHDRRDSTSSPQADTAAPCLPAADDGISGLRIGYDPGILDRDGLAPAQAEAFRRAVEYCQDAGAEIKEVTVPLLNYGVAAYYIICSCEASANMTRFDGVRYGVRRGSGDLWDTYCETRGQGFSDEVKRRIMMGAYALSKGYYDAYYLKAARVRGLFTREFTKLFENIDVMLMPVTPQPPRLLGTEASPLENYLGDIFTLPANLTGMPAVSFPVGVTDGLPVAAQAMAAPFREDLLIRTAREAEKRTALPGAPWTTAKPEGGK